MSLSDIHLHFVQFSLNKVVNKQTHPESYDIDCIHYIVNFVIDFVQNAVDDFIDNHQHLCSLKHLHPRRLRYRTSVNVHRNTLDFEKLLIEIRKKAGNHICFLCVGSEVTTPPFFERNIVVIHLPDLNGLHYKEVLSTSSHNELISLGLGVGEALHEIGHMFGAFHSTCGIMSRQQNAVGLFGITSAEIEMESHNCFFDNYSICLFAHSLFFNRGVTSRQPSSLLFRISDGQVHLKCSTGILLVVIIQGTKYHDLKVYDALLSVSIRIDEQLWDLMQVYSGSYQVENIIK
ncbi:hypothetical protein Angca_002091 [Angiostrongylus cantonensis]|nr:hypothetical protein Angca_002091 [Angiostrongylus cantonensis]